MCVFSLTGQFLESSGPRLGYFLIKKDRMGQNWIFLSRTDSFMWCDSLSKKTVWNHIYHGYFYGVVKILRHFCCIQHDMVRISNTIYILVIVFVFVLSLHVYLSFGWCGYKSCFLLKSRGIIYIPYCRVHIEGEYIKYSAGALQNIVIGILSKNLHIYGKWDL